MCAIRTMGAKDNIINAPSWRVAYIDSKFDFDEYMLDCILDGGEYGKLYALKEVITKALIEHDENPTWFNLMMGIGYYEGKKRIKLYTFKEAMRFLKLVEL